MTRSVITRDNITNNLAVGTVTVRTTCECDLEAVQDFFNGLSPCTLYNRFFAGYSSVPSSILADLVADTATLHNLVAQIGAKIIGHALWSMDGTGVVECGLVVSEGHRRRGVATMLFHRVLDAAVHAGANQLRLDVLYENREVAAWVRRIVPGIRLKLDGIVLTGYVPIDRATVASIEQVFGRLVS